LDLNRLDFGGVSPTFSDDIYLALDLNPTIQGDGTRSSPLQGLYCALDTAILHLSPSAWLEALKAGNLVEVDRLLSVHGSSILSVRFNDDNLISAIHVVASCGHSHLIAPLYKAGALINVRAPSGMMPIHIAAAGGHSLCLRELAAHGASVEAKVRLGLRNRILNGFSGGYNGLNSLEISLKLKNWGCVAVFPSIAPSFCEMFLQCAIRQHQSDVVTSLLCDGFFPVSNTLLQKVAKDHDVPSDILRELISHCDLSPERDIRHTFQILHSSSSSKS
jgi:hypothetical protein